MATSEKIIFCDDCKYEWPFKSTKVEETRWEDDEGKLFIATLFKCPSCGKEYLICIDDEATLLERGEITTLHRAIQRAVKTRSSAYSFLVARIERVQTHLAKHQDQLKETYLSRLANGLLKEIK